MRSPGAQSVETSRKPYPAVNESRRSVRQKVHLPAQAGLTALADRGFDSIEVLDLSEDGACIQTSFPLKPNSMLTLSLDLMETNAFVSTSGVVVWSDQRGHNGVHFREISEASRQQLKHWLLTHATAVRGTQPRVADDEGLRQRPVRTRPVHAESKREFAKREFVQREFVKQSPELTRAALAASAKEPELPVPGDYSSVLSALVAVKREVEATGSDLDGVLQLLSARALSLTHATGAAIALSDHSATGEMICRARTGSDAPGLGAKLQAGSGFSGECVRSNKVLRCDDAETDPRVDREGCRMLGIRSIIAAPVRGDYSVAGILEVFSPNPHSFGPNEEKTLERLAQMIAGAMNHSEPGQSAAPAPAAMVAPVQIVEPRAMKLEIPAQIERLLEPTSSPSRRLLFVLLGIGLIAGAMWLVVDGTTGKFSNSSQSRAPAQQNPAKNQSSTAVLKTADFESLRKLAADGDPDAQFDIGARYATGEDVKQDYAESVRWFTLAAEQGHVIAQATLGAYYWAGRGIPQDLSKAYFWSAIAQAGGDAASKYRVTVLATRMSHSQVAAAQQQADEWLKKHKIAERTAK
jgi:GAF domain/PilZ domain/Sel1 repeat